jgi:hypothetical protein
VWFTRKVNRTHRGRVPNAHEISATRCRTLRALSLLCALPVVRPMCAPTSSVRVAGLSGLRATKSPRSLHVPPLGLEPVAPAARRRPRLTAERCAALRCVSSLAAWLGALDARTLLPCATSVVAPRRARGSRKPPGHEDIADRHEKPRPSRRQRQAHDDDDRTKIMLGECWLLRGVEVRGDCYESQCWPPRSFWPPTLTQTSTMPGASHARLRHMTAARHARRRRPLASPTFHTGRPGHTTSQIK